MRPLELKKTPVRYLHGVGEKRAALFEKLDVFTAYDLLFHYPRSYEDWRPVTVEAAVPGTVCAIRAVMGEEMKGAKIRKNLTIFKGTAFDETGKLWLTMFNTRFAALNLKLGQEYVFYGKVEGNAYHKTMSTPKILSAEKAPPVVPRYPATEGLTQRILSDTVEKLLASIDYIDDPLPPDLSTRMGLCPLDQAVRAIHRPATEEELEAAVKRLVFGELFTMELGLLSHGRKSRVRTDKIMHPCDMTPFYDSLPFALTGAQRRAIDEAAADLTRDVPMNRLLQGDVGSGKTAVAAALMFAAKQSGCQSVLMAPTEILTEQHFDTMKKFLRPLGLSVAMLTGSVKGAVREEILQALADGSIDVLVATHAVLEDNVLFDKLGLVVTDEQHRFGVEQRKKLTRKGGPAHTLVMSATPIPRTLALMIYGDLDISVLDELPPGRRKIRTYHVGTDARERVDGFIEKHIRASRQVYVVCPAIDDGSEDSATEHYQRLCKRFPEARVGLIHGQKKAAEKEAVMGAFVKGELDVLVATTVIEVGVDVPNATLMIVEEADRFGLSQLHQLRGRVGRSDKQSFCVLVSDAKTQEATARLTAMVDSSDGFEIARRDLELRGPGDFFGSRQHGLPLLRIADLHTDMDTLQAAAKEAAALLDKDPHLSLPEHLGLREDVETLFEETAN